MLMLVRPDDIGDYAHAEVESNRQLLGVGTACICAYGPP